ncbi:MAG: phospholipid carrier-dependent glycosyltransferase [Chloroflexota bacterium]
MTTKSPAAYSPNTIPFSAVTQKQSSRLWTMLAAAVLLLLAFGLMVSSAVRKSSTVDEQTHLFRGTAYLLEHATQFRDVHPPLGFALQALPLLTEPDLQLPVDTPAWAEGRWEIAADAFLWQLNANPQRILLLGRMSTMWLVLLLGAVVFRWGRQLGGAMAAITAMTLLLFDPNILAHGRLFTNDISGTFFMILATYGYWRWTKTGRWTAVALTGLGLGLAGATKYSAVTLVPALGAIALWLAWQRRSWLPIVALGVAGVGAVMVIWALYSFPIRPVPLAPWWDDLAWTMDYFQRPSGAYLLGETRAGGWWYYFPVAYLVKTPLATLVLAAWAVVASLIAIIRDHKPGGLDWLSWAFLVLPPGVYIAVSLIGPLNIGYRHLLPALPYIAIFIAVSLIGDRGRSGRWVRFLVPALSVSVIALSVVRWPDYIPYFNKLAGGPDRNWLILSDSNIDWGQDLPALVTWNNARQDNLPLYVSYFGTAHPQAYGLDYLPIPTWAPGPEQLSPDRRTYDPADPAPGWYAVSVTNLHGQVLDNPDLYARFRDQEPALRIGDSIRVYQVAPRGQPFDLALAGLTPAELTEPIRDALPGNDRQLRWIDDSNALIWSADGLWLATAVPVAEPLQTYLPPLEVSDDGQTLYYLESPPDVDTVGMTFGSTFTLLSSQVVDSADDTIGVLTYWGVDQSTDRPIKLFVHALDDSGQILSQWDGLSVDTSSLQPGDRFMQLHVLPEPDTDLDRLVVGVYDAETLERLALPDGQDSVTIPMP